MVIRLLYVLLVGAAVWYGWRLFRRNQARVANALRDLEGVLGQRKSVELERDPETGVYRPKNRRE
jgi:hypothetical protein